MNFEGKRSIPIRNEEEPADPVPELVSTLEGLKDKLGDPEPGNLSIQERQILGETLQSLTQNSD